MRDRLINILVDFAFKKVFAGEGEESKIILMDFLNSILELKGDKRISEIVYLNTFNDREFEEDKQSVMDIKVKVHTGELIDIEVQISDIDDYRKRSLYYWSKLYGETISKGEPYYNLKKSIVINILDFNLINENNKYHNVFGIKEREDNFNFIEDLEIHYIELGKFEPKEIENLSDIEEWITFLRECSPDGDLKVAWELSKKKEEIGAAMAIMEKLSADEVEYQLYLAREKYLRDEISKKKYAEHKMQKIKDELETRKKELETTSKELENKNNQINSAIVKLLNQGFDNNMVANILNVSLEDIEKVKKEL
ncbi:MAG: Rpn family recombination-promoting nuclease/putative transposase [Clostridium sp.]